MFSLESRIHLVLGQPLDVFGNPVDADGTSRDHRGRPVDRKRYVQVDDKPVFDSQRDFEYTHELSGSIADSYRQNTVIKPIHLVARAMFDWLEETNPELDLYRLLRTGGVEQSMPLTDAYRRMERYLLRMRELEQQSKLRLAESMHTRDTVKIVSQALAHLKSYHRRPAVERRGDRLFHTDRNLLLFYKNRLKGVDLGRVEASP